MMTGEPCFTKNEAEIIKKHWRSHVLHVDFDYPWPEHWITAWKIHVADVLAHRRIFVERIIIKPSPSRKGGSHCWIHVRSQLPLSDDEVNFLQWICCDDKTRVWINILRVKRGLKKYWSKLFDHHIWKKKMPKRCRECKLREILGEMKEAYNE